MAKKVTGQVKLQIAAGKATPAPPVGPALGQAQINIMEFCKQFNAKTASKDLEGFTIPVVITVYNDRSFTFVTKTPPASDLLRKAAGVRPDAVQRHRRGPAGRVGPAPDWSAAAMSAASLVTSGRPRRTASSKYVAS